jgi:hypothetical protein
MFVSSRRGDVQNLGSKHRVDDPMVEIAEGGCQYHQPFSVVIDKCAFEKIGYRRECQDVLSTPCFSMGRSGERFV